MIEEGIHFAMENCSSCGARLSPGIAWCGQCYAPVAAAPAPPSPAPPAPEPATTEAHPGARAPADARPTAPVEPSLPTANDHSAAAIEAMLQAARTPPPGPGAVLWRLGVSVSFFLAVEFGTFFFHGAIVLAYLAGCGAAGWLLLRRLWRVRGMVVDMANREEASVAGSLPQVRSRTFR